MPQGYEAFVSCTRTTEKGRTCYSGTLLNVSLKFVRHKFHLFHRLTFLCFFSFFYGHHN